MKTVHLIIKGRVQGVFYRASAKRHAEELHITGWVKNTEEGDVEVIATGEEKPLEEFIKWCHKGPAAARVDQVDVSYEPLQDFNGFTILK